MSRLLAFGIFVFASSFGVDPALAAPPYSQATETLLERAQTQIEAREWITAHDLISKGLALDPKHDRLNAMAAVVEDAAYKIAKENLQRARVFFELGQYDDFGDACYAAITYEFNDQGPVHRKCGSLTREVLLQKASDELGAGKCRAARLITTELLEEGVNVGKVLTLHRRAELACDRKAKSLFGEAVVEQAAGNTAAATDICLDAKTYVSGPEIEKAAQGVCDQLIAIHHRPRRPLTK